MSKQFKAKMRPFKDLYIEEVKWRFRSGDANYDKGIRLGWFLGSLIGFVAGAALMRVVSELFSFDTASVVAFLGFILLIIVGSIWLLKTSSFERHYP